jgi:hypothetical protein
MTNDRGPDSCIDAVGLEAHSWGKFDAVWTEQRRVSGLRLIGCITPAAGNILDVVPSGLFT